MPCCRSMGKAVTKSHWDLQSALEHKSDPVSRLRHHFFASNIASCLVIMLVDVREVFICASGPQDRRHIRVLSRRHTLATTGTAPIDAVSNDGIFCGVL